MFIVVINVILSTKMIFSGEKMQHVSQISYMGCSRKKHLYVSFFTVVKSNMFVSPWNSLPTLFTLGADDLCILVHKCRCFRVQILDSTEVYTKKKLYLISTSRILFFLIYKNCFPLRFAIDFIRTTGEKYWILLNKVKKYLHSVVGTD